MSGDVWLADIGAVTDVAGTRASLDATTLDRIASLLDVDRSELTGTTRCLVRLYGGDLAAFEMRTNTWRIDLPAAVVKSVLTGTVTATVLHLLGAESIPVAVLSFIAPLIFEIKRIEAQPSDVVIQAQLHAAIGDGPRRLPDLYDALSAETRAELTTAEFADVVERLLRARRAVAGPDGLRIRALGAQRGFRLVLWEPPLLPEVLLLTEPGAGSTGMVEDQAAQARAPMSGPPPGYRPRVFVSYAHDSPSHKKRVLEFCRFLVETGIDVRMDQWDLSERRDWQLWATAQIRDADFVLVVASPMCRKVGDGEIAPLEHRGMQSEMRTLRELYHSDPGTWPRKILPVVLPGGSVSDIPLFLQPRTADHFRVASFSTRGAEDLLRLMTGQPADARPAPGPPPVLPPRSVSAAEAAETG